MTRRIAAGVLAVVALGMGSGLAGAEPADQSPIGGSFAHTHHIHTGNGECHDIDQNLFEPKQAGEARHRGLHQGALNGQVGHGTCLTHP